MRICVIDCTADKFMVRGMTRKTSSGAYSRGVECVEDDILLRHGGNTLPRVPLENIRGFDVALLSLASVQDVESFIVAAASPNYRKGHCRIIAGGPGCLNIHSFSDYIDVAIFGRCDAGQINDVLDGKDAANVWRKEIDRDITGEYEIGQFRPPKKKFETGTIGCRLRCAYCQYTHTRRHDNLPYRPERNAPETDLWASDFSKVGAHVSAIDGLTEETRMRVNKPISDRFLVKKIKEAFSEHRRGKMSWLKLYNIIGYPWETPETIKRDYEEFMRLIESIDRKTGKWRIKILLQNTPFSPEPITPMECCRVQFADYRGAMKGEYLGVDLTVKSTPFLQGAIQHAKRVAINRCTRALREKVRAFLRDEIGLREVRDVTDNCEIPARYLKRPVEYERIEYV